MQESSIDKPKKILFRYEKTLTDISVQLLIKELVSEGYEIHIISKYNKKDSNEIECFELFRIAKELRIKRSNIFFTNGAYYWNSLLGEGYLAVIDNDWIDVSITTKKVKETRAILHEKGLNGWKIKLNNRLKKWNGK